MYNVYSLQNIMTTALGIGAITDAVIAFALCYFLRAFRNGSERYVFQMLLRTLWKLTPVFSADSLVYKLIKYAIGTGALTRYAVHEFQ